MRVPRAIRASLAGLGIGYAASLMAVLWMKASSGDAEALWNLLSPLRVATWFVTSAHAVPLVVRSAAGVTAPEAAGSIGRLSELLGGGENVVFSFSVVLVPVTILTIIGIAVALLVRWSKPSSPRDVLRTVALAAGVHGIVLALAARLSSVDLVFEGTLAPDLGLGAATGRVGLGLGPSPATALVLGVVFGAAFAAAGAISSLSIRSSLAPSTRVVLLGWMRGLGTVAGIIASVLALGGLVALVTGRAPALSLFALGGYLLSANAVAAGIVGVHGVPMAVALDAGPFTGWERMDLLHFGVSGNASPKVLLLAVVVPIIGGVVAGRFCRRPHRRVVGSDARRPRDVGSSARAFFVLCGGRRPRRRKCGVRPIGRTRCGSVVGNGDVLRRCACSGRRSSQSLSGCALIARLPGRRDADVVVFAVPDAQHERRPVLRVVRRDADRRLS